MGSCFGFLEIGRNTSSKVIRNLCQDQKRESVNKQTKEMLALAKFVNEFLYKIVMSPLPIQSIGFGFNQNVELNPLDGIIYTYKKIFKLFSKEQ